MRIVICDDEEKCCRALSDAIQDYCRREGIEDVLIHTYQSALDMLEQYPRDADIIFLDIQMPAIDGIQAAREIRKYDTKVQIVFTTNYERYAIDGYSVQAYNYLLKPLKKDVLARELRTLFQICRERQGVRLQLKGADGYYSFSSDEIDYVETDGKNVILHIRKETIPVFHSMKKMEELLMKEPVFRIHTAYLISFRSVKQIRKDSVILQSGEELPLSRHRKKEFLQQYMEYIGGML